jgi:ubiquinone/menaquinone biosynthesis C-methylase UbiE
MSKLSEAARYAWNSLPEEIVGSRSVSRLRRDINGRLGRPANERVIHTLDELDEILEELTVAASVSDDQLRQGFRSFRMEIDFPQPDDPYSDEYRVSVLQLYEWLHGSPYSLANEETGFDLASAVDAPFPYSTQSARTVGDQLMAIGHIVRVLDLPPGSRVLELGAGWGNPTLALAQMGHQVTAIDISARFVELINARAARVNASVETIVGDFSTLHDLDHRFDAVLFFESFHHCENHLQLLSGLDRVVLPGGRVLFAAEPITKWFPLPWGLRLDGESLWAIRRNGWLELGFRRSYFEQTLHRYGWKTDFHCLRSSPWGEVFVATRQ